MHTSTHTFIHTFRDEGVLILRVDFSTSPPTMTSLPRTVTKSQQREYQEWLNEVVAPEIVRLCDVAQLVACVDKGLEVLKQ